MDFHGLWDALKERMSPGSTAIQTEPGQTYGPAESRLTRVPITFSQTAMPQNQSGEYVGPTPIGQKYLGSKGQITINPTSSDVMDNYKGNVNAAIKHEIAHSIVMPATTDDNLEQMARQNPAYSNVESHLAQSERGGWAPAEASSYMAEPNAARYGISDDLQSLYRKNFVNQLSGVNPAAAQLYQRLIGQGVSNPLAGFDPNAYGRDPGFYSKGKK